MPNQTPPVVLAVNGLHYGGWETVRVTRRLEALCGDFNLSVFDRWGDQGQPWPLTQGDQCEILLHGVRVIKGAIDARDIALSARERSISVRGRDAAADLVDCSALLPHWEFRQVTALDVAQKLGGSVNVHVNAAPGLTFPTLKKFGIDPGESLAEALERLCRPAGVLAISDGNGGILLTRAGSTRCTSGLAEAGDGRRGNIIEAQASFNHTGRFHRYVALGSHAGADHLAEGAAASVRGEAIDPEVSRAHRVLVIRPEGNLTPAAALKRAQWEATVRAARAASFSITVAGWTQSDGTLWPINSLVTVDAPSLGLTKTSLLISEVEYTLDGDGMRTALQLAPPGTFDPEPQATHVSGNAPPWKEIAGGVTLT